MWLDSGFMLSCFYNLVEIRTGGAVCMSVCA